MSNALRYVIWGGAVLGLWYVFTRFALLDIVTFTFAALVLTFISLFTIGVMTRNSDG